MGNMPRLAPCMQLFKVWLALATFHKLNVRVCPASQTPPLFGAYNAQADGAAWPGSRQEHDQERCWSGQLVCSRCGEADEGGDAGAAAAQVGAVAGSASSRSLPVQWWLQ